MASRPQYPYVEESLLASGARTASGQSETFDNYGWASALRLQLNVSGASGTTPTLDVIVEDTVDGINWNPIATFTQKTVVGREVVNVTAPFADRVRVRWTVGGTAPSFTFSVICASQAPQVA